MIYNELKNIEDEKAHLMARLKGAKKAMKKKKPRKKKNLNPVSKTKFMISNDRHLRNNSVRRSRRNSLSSSQQLIKRGRGYHALNNFVKNKSPTSENRSVFKNSVFRSSVDPHENQYKSIQHSGFGKQEKRSNWKVEDTGTRSARRMDRKFLTRLCMKLEKGITCERIVYRIRIIGRFSLKIRKTLNWMN